MRECGFCRARRSRGGVFSLAFSSSKAIGRNSQISGIPPEILKISVFCPVCVRAFVYASGIPVDSGGSAEKSPSVSRFRPVKDQTACFETIKLERIQLGLTFERQFVPKILVNLANMNFDLLPIRKRPS